MPITAPPPAAEEQTLWRGTPSRALLFAYPLAMVITLIAVPLAGRAASRAALDIEAAARNMRVAWWLTAILLFIEILLLGVALLRLRSTVYTVTNQRVMIETGLVTKALQEIDLRYVDDSAFTQGVLHRLLGIGNVTLISSDKTTPTYVLRAIRDPRGLRELIRTHAYKVSHRQIFTRAT